MPITEQRFQAECDECGKMETAKDDITPPDGWFTLHLEKGNRDDGELVACSAACAHNVIGTLAAEKRV